MTLSELMQIKKDRDNGVILSRVTIDSLIQHAMTLEARVSDLMVQNKGLHADNYYLKQQLAKAKSLNGEKP